MTPHFDGLIKHETNGGIKIFIFDAPSRKMDALNVLDSQRRLMDATFLVFEF